MKQIIRQGVFESNSSSSHSISIMATPQTVQIPNKIHFRIHTYNHYADDNMNTVEGRANYLYSIAMWREEENRFKKVIRRLLDDRVELIFEGAPDWWREDDDWNERWDLINHQASEEALQLFGRVMADDTLLLNYLFDDKTEVEICGDWAIQGVTGGSDRAVFGYTTEQVEEWEDE